MSQKKETNFVKNGDFSGGKTEWAVSEEVKFENGYCVVTKEGLAQQRVSLETDVKHCFSVWIKTAPGSAALARFTTEGTTIEFRVPGGQDWKEYTADFVAGHLDVPNMISLRAEDGKIGDYGCFYDNVSIILIPRKGYTSS